MVSFKRLKYFFISFLTDIALSKELHSHHSKDEDDDAEDEGEVSQGPHCLAHDGDEQVQSGPGLGKFEDTKLEGKIINSERLSLNETIASSFSGQITIFERCTVQHIFLTSLCIRPDLAMGPG